MSVQFDTQARRDALDGARSFIVRAPAGSGKTELLVQRFLTLLGYAEQPQEVLAITFTNKAAAEMRARVIEAIHDAATLPEPTQSPALERWRLGRSVLARDTARQWHLLQRPEQLNVHTFDAFSRRVASLAPLTADSRALSKLLEDPQPLYEEAARLALFESSSADAAVLLRAADNQVDKVVALVANLLARRAQWLPHLGDTSPASLARLRTVIEAAITVTLQPLLELWSASHRAAARRFALFAADQLEPGLLRDQLRAVADAPNDEHFFATAASISYWRAIQSWLMTQKGEWKKDVNKNSGFPAAPTGNSAQANEFKAFKADAKQWLEALTQSSLGTHLSARIVSAAALPDAAAMDRHEPMYRATMTVLKIAAAQLMLIENSRCVTDFSGIALAAQQALEVWPEEVAQRLDAQIRHVLVDEFQDTSPAQSSMIRSLSAEWSDGDGRTMFLVGDPMQSIYGFRDADVGLFLDAWAHGFPSIRFTRLTLQSNYRSRPELVNWVNRELARCFADRSPDAERSIEFSAAFAARGADSHCGVSIASMSDSEEEACWIAETIEQAQRQNSKVRIAVIVRSKASAGEILREFTQRRIGFVAQEFAKWPDRPIIRDLVSLTYVLTQPHDEFSWFAWLRSPMVGLRLSTLSALAAGCAERCDVRAALGALGDAVVGSFERQQIASAMAAYDEALAAASSATLSERVHTLWIACGGLRIVQSQGERDEVSAYLALLDELAPDGLLPARQGFEARIAKQFMSFDQLGVFPPVDVLTIHKAKGLEWDVVFVPASDRVGRPPDRALLAWQFLRSDQQVSLIAAARETRKQTDAPSVFDFVQTRRAGETAEELKRLLYVAATRARERLYFSGSNGARAPRQHTFAALLPWPSMDDQRVDIEAQLPSKSVKAMPHSLWRVDLDAEPTFTSTAARSVERARAHSPQLGSMHSVSDSSHAAHDENAVAFGVVGHRLLDALGRGITPSPSIAQLRGALQSEGAHTMQIEALAQTLYDTLTRWKHSDAIAFLFSESHVESASELSLVVSEKRHTVLPASDTSLTLLRIDRTFVTAHGERWIVDYKFSAPPHDAALSVWLDEQRLRHRAQLLTYRKAIGELAAESIDRPIILALYFPLLDRLERVDVGG
ncbi:MAG: hypothetical protein EAZ37_01110 [Burkholderiales bacterium]|nr:MAG: hypothetical protein EAZ43_08710 [Betaproteobacteria bacterium]TAG28618.1 MAG: hypothetical protein EAZ37_01110 [Burkholderiales bacterium]